MNMQISQSSFNQIREYVHRTAGITIGPEKSAMVTSRLWRRLEMTACKSYEAYLAFVASNDGFEERCVMLDLLTTNETYFFREPAHFKRLAQQILPQVRPRPVRVWCAAASTGEEPYSLAMVLADHLGMNNWELLATDISRKVLMQAERGLYRMERLEQMPPQYLKQYCLRGVDEYHGQLAVHPKLRAQVKFAQHNLLHPLTGHEKFDVIFLRNVLIYFDQPTKQLVLDRVLQNLRPGGWLILGHCESLMGLTLPLSQEVPSVYRKKAETSYDLLRVPA
jgi:chemotaxis protein methyltransferase CheR